jgi:hypothetical protein
MARLHFQDKQPDGKGRLAISTLILVVVAAALGF